MSKLPQDVRVQVARNTAREVRKISVLLEVIRQEVEAPEISEGVKTNVQGDKPKQLQMKLPSTTTLIAKNDT